MESPEEAPESWTPERETWLRSAAATEAASYSSYDITPAIPPAIYVSCSIDVAPLPEMVTLLSEAEPFMASPPMMRPPYSRLSSLSTLPHWLYRVYSNTTELPNETFVFANVTELPLTPE